MSIVTCRSHRSLKPSQTADEKIFHYVGGTSGPWRITKIDTQIGLPLRAASHVDINVGPLASQPFNASWILRGVASSTRFITRDDASEFTLTSSPSHQSQTPCAALILIRRCYEWWNLDKAERTEFQKDREDLLHTNVPFFSTIAKRFQFQRKRNESFDFMAWIEYEASDAALLDEIASTFRRSREWFFVDREIDIRMERV